eukprot:GHVR01102674.1.p1 GENE.GHVR01102674.1~~GHVR01102674.1.p1  ORF type:complete len:160 (+),score=8.92 GHVR01102674.1:202-681(+)
MSKESTLPILLNLEDFENWRFRFKWYIKKQLIGVKEEEDKETITIHSLLEASKKVSAMELKVHKFAKKSPIPKLDRILDELEEYFLPHKTQRANIAWEKFCSFNYTCVGSPSLRDTLNAFDSILEEGERVGLEFHKQELYMVLLRSIVPDKRLLIQRSN